MERDIGYIQRQLILARWHLDAAIGATSDSAFAHLTRARLAYASVLEAIADIELAAEHREEIDTQLVAVRSRLDMSQED
jgi:hypothetical protein